METVLPLYKLLNENPYTKSVYYEVYSKRTNYHMGLGMGYSRATAIAHNEAEQAARRYDATGLRDTEADEA